MPPAQKADIEGLLKKELNGKSVEDHLLSVLDALITRNRNDAYKTFEVVSRFVKNGGETAFDVGELEGVDAAVSKALDVRKLPGGDDEGGTTLCGVPDIAAELELTKWAGFGFSAAETDALANSFRHLATKADVQKVRLWGKILGSKADYYVAEGKFGGEIEAAEGVEPANDTGVNFYTYWVTTNVYSLEPEWVQLPLATPAHIAASRKVKKILTGNLEAPVISHPHFPGVEKHLLRSVVADISAGTILAPKGYYRRPEGAEDERAIEEVEHGKEPDQFQMPLAKQLASKSMWVHARENILLSGRTTKPEAPEDTGEGDEDGTYARAKAAYDEALRLDPWVPAIQEIAKDAPPEGFKHVWSVTTAYDPTERAVQVQSEEGEGGEGGTTTQISSYGVVAIKSLLWPGSVCVCQGSEFVNIYVGYGHKVGTYYPIAPPAVMDEPDDLEEQPEPTPLEEEPEVVEEVEGEGEG